MMRSKFGFLFDVLEKNLKSDKINWENLQRIS